MAHRMKALALAAAAAAIAMAGEPDGRVTGFGGYMGELRENLSYSDSGDWYGVTVTLPEVAAGFPGMAAGLAAYADTLLTSFYFGLPGEGEEPVAPYALELYVSHEPSPEGMVCLMAYVYVYAGGAHGMNWSRSWVFDPGDSLFVDPVSLLGDSTAFAAFAGQVRDSLLARLDSDSSWIVRGTLPKRGNYEALLPVPDSSGGIGGFRVELAPYQVAPYVSGSSEVVVRY